MKKKTFRGLSVLLLLVILTLSFTSCFLFKGGDVLSKEEILSNISAEEDKNQEYVTTYLNKWGLSNLSFRKMEYIENIYKEAYYKDIPDAYTLAVGTANLFLEHFYDETDLTQKEDVTDKLIACYVEMIGDPYSFYRTKDEYEDYGTDMSGSFAGIGVTIQYSYIEETMTVTAVTIGAGAESAGVLPGDIITKVDGVSVKELGYQKAVSTIRGKVGTRVKISVDRNGEELTFDIERKQITEQTVTYRVEEIGGKKVGYISITDFKRITSEQFKNAIDYMELEKVSGIIYDLRGNPGGYLDVVVDMLSYIAPKGTEIVSFSNGYGDGPLKSDSDHTVTLPSVVLCNESTASAGELFTAAIRDFGAAGMFDALTVGKTTYGKGVMQTSIEFIDSSAITLTVAYYNPPCGINYDGVGIVPDIEVELSDTEDTQLIKAREAILSLLNK